MTTTPAIDAVSSMSRIPSTAAWSAEILSPRPIQRPAAIAADSVTRTSSSARLRSGAAAEVPARTPVSAAWVTRQSYLGSHSIWSLDADEVEAASDHRLSRPDEHQAELLGFALQHPVVVVEAVEVVGDADRVVRQGVRAAPLDGLRDYLRELRQPLDQILFLAGELLRTLQQTVAKSDRGVSEDAGDSSMRVLDVVDGVLLGSLP